MTIGFSEREFDETELARQTARALGLPFKAVLLPSERVADGLDDCIRAMDEPSVDGLNSFWISKIAAEQGFKVALSGQGGDELFGGYTSWKWFKRFESAAAWTSRFPSGLSRLFDRQSWPYRWRKLSYLFGTSDPFLASQLAVRILFLESDLRALVGSAARRRQRTRRCPGISAELRVRAWPARWSRQIEPHGHLRPPSAEIVAGPRCHEHGSQPGGQARFPG